MITNHNQQITHQFDTRSSTFEKSAYWITDKNLTQAHVELAGSPHGTSLEMCCGTAAVSKALKAAGWNVTGVDISPGMVAQAQKEITALVGDVTQLPLKDHSFDVILMRQAYFLLDNGPGALREVRRLLKPGGKFILSHLVPFSKVDSDYLQQVHAVKQAQMKKFFTTELLKTELEENGFKINAEKFVVVRESVSLWMEQAPELSKTIQQKVCDMVSGAPASYQELRRVENRNGEIFEDWNFVLLSATPT